MREKLTTLAELVGLALVAYGVALVSVPAGVVAAGLCLVAVGFLEGRR